MASNVSIAVPTATTSNTSKPYTIYHISLRQPLRNYTVQKRYSDFCSLHDSLRAQANQTPPAPLPQKTWFKSTVSNPELIEERRRGLEQYLVAINDAPDPRWRTTGAWRTFLNLPGSNNASGSSTARPPTRTGGPISELRVPLTDSMAWLDAHKDLKTQLRDVKLALARREQARTAQQEHEASADAKRNLVRVATMLSALDAGLQSQGAKVGGVNGGTALGEGEIRRRRDLLASARNERDVLEEQMNSKASRESRRALEAVQLASGATETSLSSTPDSARGSSRRVLGGQARETERTRELDNAGVLQLQKQIMAEQDTDVTDLTAIVRRMREMGVQINDELQLQNEMVAIIDQDVERVGNKVNVAKKRIGKIK